MSFYTALTEAINEFEEHGFSDQAALESWMGKLRKEAEQSLSPQATLESLLRASFRATYKRMVDDGGVLVSLPVKRFTLDRVAPRLRAELDRRIMASAQLIKLNRQNAIDTTLRRFSGWATSIPAGGSKSVEKVETKTEIRKALTQLPFDERRVIIDQNHKLVATINDVVAQAGGAIAAEWHSHYRQAGYNYRPEHKERDGKIYLIRGCWAQEQGLAKPGPDGYLDEITQPGEEVFCRCSVKYLFSLRKLPDEMLTKRGQNE